MRSSVCRKLAIGIVMLVFGSSAGGQSEKSTEDANALCDVADVLVERGGRIRAIEMLEAQRKNWLADPAVNLAALKIVEVAIADLTSGAADDAAARAKVLEKRAQYLKMHELWTDASAAYEEAMTIPYLAPEGIAQLKRGLTIVAVARATTLKNRAELLQQQGAWADARAGYEEAMKVPNLTPEFVADLKEGLANSAKARAKEFEARAKQLEGRGAWAGAEAALDEAMLVPNLPPGMIEDLRRAKWRVKDSEEESKKWGPALWSSLGAVFHEVTQWLAIGALGLVLVLAASKIRRWRSPALDTALSVEDLTAPADAAIRTAQSRALWRAVRTEVEWVSGTSRGADRPLNGLEVPGESLMLKLIPTVDADAAVLEFLGEDRLSVGPLSFTSKQLYVVLRGLWRKPYRRRMDIRLYADGEATVIALEESVGRSRGDRGASAFDVYGRGESAREDAVRAFAARLAFDLIKKRVCRNAESFGAMMQAERIVSEMKGDPSRTKKARELLEQALHHDPLNPYARIQLGALLREEDWRTAADHLRQVIAYMSSAREGDDLSRIVAERPELPMIAWYNLAAALLVAEDWNAHKEAVRILEDLVIRRLPDATEVGTLSPGWFDRLWLMSRSGLASALVFELEQMARGHERDAGGALGDVQRRMGYARTIQIRIGELVREVEAYSLRDASVAFAKTAAEAIAYGAAGEAAFLLHEPDAEQLIREAVKRRPDSVEPYLRLARNLLNEGLEQSGRAAEFHRTIEDVLRRRPGNAEAYFLRGRQYEAAGNEEQALIAYEEAGDHPWAVWNRADILRSRQESARLALALIARAIKLLPGADFRAIAYCETLLLLPPGEDRRGDVSRGVEFAKALLESPKERFKKRGAELLDAMEERLGFNRRDNNIERYAGRLEREAEGVPVATDDLNAAASVAARAYVEVRRCFALLKVAERTEWNAAVAAFEAGLAALRKAMAIYRSDLEGGAVIPSS